jgi:hypothetical protein
MRQEICRADRKDMRARNGMMEAMAHKSHCYYTNLLENIRVVVFHGNKLLQTATTVHHSICGKL